MCRGELLLLQINDALFPIGGYSHSYGLETYIQKELLKGEEDIKEYIKNRLKYSIVNTELLCARLAYENCQNTEYLKKLDGILTASKIPLEIRNASLKMGSRFIKTLKGCQIKLSNDSFEKYIKAEYDKKHHSTAYGVVCGAAETGIKKAIRNYAYAQCSAMVTNCVKAVPLSQSLGQKILYESYDVLDEVCENVFNMNESELCASAPAFDIRCMEHERLYSRIYMS